MGKLLYPPQANAVQKTLSAGLDQAETGSMSLNNATNIPNLPGVVVVDRIDTNGNEKSASEREYIQYDGVSGSTLTGLTRGLAQSTDQDHAVGAVVEFIPDVTWGTRVAEALATVVTDADHQVINTTNVVTPTGTQTLTNKTIDVDNNTVSNIEVDNFKASAIVLESEGIASNDNDTTLPTSAAVKDYVDSNALPSDGWISAGETWTYASADDPTFTFTISGDKTGKYSAGMRIKLTQTTAKYFIITAVSYSDPNTTITVYGGTDYDLANAAITSPYYSREKAPLGFPLSPAKWSAETTDTSNRSQASPTNGVWYNLGSLNIVIPIGVWQVYYKAKIEATDTSSVVAEVESTLSTANNSESDTDFSAAVTFLGPTGNHTYSSTVSIIKHALSLASKTTYYLNASQNNSMNSINFRGDESKTVIRAVCAYL